ncbi:hypothetical protein ACFL1X_14335 [Candidatus Hydrogenedentota bacterium]
MSGMRIEIALLMLFLFATTADGYDFATDTEKWVTGGGATPAKNAPGFLAFDITGNGPYFERTGLDFDTNFVETIEIQMKVDGDIDVNFIKLFWRGKGESFSSDRMYARPFQAHGKYQTVPFYLAAETEWSGRIEGVRLELPGYQGAEVAVDYIRLGINPSKGKPYTLPLERKLKLLDELVAHTKDAEIILAPLLKVKVAAYKAAKQGATDDTSLKGLGSELFEMFLNRYCAGWIVAGDSTARLIGPKHDLYRHEGEPIHAFVVAVNESDYPQTLSWELWLHIETAFAMDRVKPGEVADLWVKHSTRRDDLSTKVNLVALAYTDEFRIRTEQLKAEAE